MAKAGSSCLVEPETLSPIKAMGLSSCPQKPTEALYRRCPRMDDHCIIHHAQSVQDGALCVSGSVSGESIRPCPAWQRFTESRQKPRKAHRIAYVFTLTPIRRSIKDAHRAIRERLRAFESVHVLHGGDGDALRPMHPFDCVQSIASNRFRKTNCIQPIVTN